MELVDRTTLQLYPTLVAIEYPPFLWRCPFPPSCSVTIYVSMTRAQPFQNSDRAGRLLLCAIHEMKMPYRKSCPIVSPLHPNP